MIKNLAVRNDGNQIGCVSQYIYILLVLVNIQDKVSQKKKKKKKKDNVCDVNSTKSQVCGPIKC